MIRSSRPPKKPDQPNDEQELLQSLLEHVPEQEKHVRPIALRSIEEQRRLAFRSFLRRTWFDDALQKIERLLLIVLLVFFAFWFLDGYVRDWLYEHGFIDAQEQKTAGVAAYQHARMTDALTTTLPLHGVLTATGQSRALPFTPSGARQDRAIPEFLPPQAITVPDKLSDRRPYRLSIPRMELDTPVKEVFVEDGVWQVADYAAGYHHGTALPGDKGNMVMAGHAGWRGSVFRHLDKLQAGDALFVEAGGWVYTYQVRERMHVWPTQVEVMQPTPTPVLTLITCTDWDTKRLVVIADLVGSRPLE